jgi:hypothetical protein
LPSSRILQGTDQNGDGSKESWRKEHAYAPCSFNQSAGERLQPARAGNNRVARPGEKIFRAVECVKSLEENIV